jgi:intergrase/recombinase
LNPRPPECKSLAPPFAEMSLNYDDFKVWLEKRYSKKYASSIQYYVKKYIHLYNGRLSELDSFSRAKRRMALSSLIALSKYLGQYNNFKQRIDNFGLKWSGRNNYDSFRRIWNNDAADIPDWLKKCYERFDFTYATFIKFCAISGLRKSEAINSFNLILELKKQNRINDYYNVKLETLEHYRFPELFLRRSKNTYLSFIPKEFLPEIFNCHRVSNVILKRRFNKYNMKCRLQHLRHYCATNLIQNGLLREEADLLQGRIGRSVFMQHYFSPSIEDLKNRTLKLAQSMLRSSA